MPAPTDALFTPPSSYSPQKTLSRLDLRLDSHSDDSLDGDIFNMNNMAGTGSPSPYIKEEIEDMQFGTRGFMPQSGVENAQFGNQPYSAAPDNNMSGINPSDLAMTGNFTMNNHFGGSSYISGGANIPDDELADSLNNLDTQQGFGGFEQDNFFPGHTNGASTSQANMNHMYSNTPDDLPIQSPFVHPSHFDFGQYGSTPQRIGFPQNSMRAANGRMGMPAIHRQQSDSRSPMSPRGQSVPGVHFGTPDSGNFASQPIMATMHRRQKSVSDQWNHSHTPGSVYSLDSPTASPHTAGMHAQITEVIHGGKSLPTKVDLAQNQDAKKRRRRESHNLVERRRRDNINERIHDLSRLVPQHRLEDEKVRKHINNNGPLSPAIASGMSPPQATSLLAGGTGKRAAGNITTGLPLEEKDKGPNKGDILNGAVSWTRDLMWMLHKKIRDADEMAERLRQLTGEDWPTEQTEEERRMRTEIEEAVDKNKVDAFKYSRGPGSGLRVPKHTTIAGDPLGQISPQSLSPGMQSNDSGSNVNSTGNNNNNTQQYWMNQQSGSNSNPFILKEEDEYNSMEM